MPVRAVELVGRLPDETSWMKQKRGYEIAADQPRRIRRPTAAIISVAISSPLPSSAPC